MPVPYGELTAVTGTLTGTLASGDPINNVFYRSSGGGYIGTIYLDEAPQVPALSPSSQLALVVSLIGAGMTAQRWRAA